jgi:hypothetical protein
MKSGSSVSNELSAETFSNGAELTLERSGLDLSCLQNLNGNHHAGFSTGRDDYRAFTPYKKARKRTD